MKQMRDEMDNNSAATAEADEGNTLLNVHG